MKISYHTSKSFVTLSLVCILKFFVANLDANFFFTLDLGSGMKKFATLFSILQSHSLHTMHDVHEVHDF
jgi:hypothetical protein